MKDALVFHPVQKLILKLLIMSNTLNILVVDDEVLIAENNKGRIIDYCSSIPKEVMNIIVCNSFEKALKSAEEIRPDFIYTDVNLSATESGFDLVEQLRERNIIDYRTQCCYYTGNNYSEFVLQHIGFDFKLKKSDTTSNQFIDVFNQMYNKYQNCNLRNVLDLKFNLFVHDLLFIEAGNGVCRLYYFNKKGKMLNSTSEKEFHKIKPIILSFDFMLPVMDTKIININVYNKLRTELRNNKQTYYAKSIKGIFPDKDLIVEANTYLEHRISTRYEEEIRKRIS